MIYNNGLGHQVPTMASIGKTSTSFLASSQSRDKISKSKQSTKPTQKHSGNPKAPSLDTGDGKSRGRCRVQWSEEHVKEGLVLVQETQLARVVKTGPIADYYHIEPKPFASGQWARVYKCRSRSTGIVYAAKYSSRSRFNADCSAELRHEIALLSLCSQSPRVVRLHDVYETPKEMIMVMEYAPGGDLQTLIDGDLVPLEGDVVHFVRQLVEGLVYLHERNIAHLDIKPQNLVMMGNFPDCSVKLCDFEISRVILEGTDVREILGTPEYVAPEILHYEPITLAADMWSLGVTTYVLLTGFSPFGGETDQETLKNIIHGQVDFPEELFEDVSIQARDFVAKLLILEPSDRMTAKQCLQHEWLRSAPTQASSHLRKYLSKSRDVLLERVVSREHLRRTALLGQTYNTACSNNNSNNNNNNLQLLLHDNQNNQNNNWTGLSQSEVCLSRGRLNGSNGSLSGGSSVGEDCWGDMIGSSRISLADSVSSNRSIDSSLGTSQSCLLNREQTEGLLSQAQDRSSMRASLAQSLNRVGLLSKIRSLNQVQSKSHMCLRSLLNGPAERDINQKQQQRIMMGSCHFDGSREKLYGLKSLSKSQGMLDIYRSLESLQRQRRSLIRQRERSKTEDALVPFFRHLRHSGTSSASSLVDSTFSARSNNNNNNDDDDDAGNDQVQHQNSIQLEAAETASMRLLIDKGTGVSGTEMVVGGSEEKASAESNLDSLQSLESDTLTDDSEVTGLSRSPRNKQSSVGSECYVDSENEEPKFSVAQLVSAFSRHQKVASSTSLEALMTEGSTDFPIGPKALQLFVSPDIDASIVGGERTTLVRRKTSYKPRKDWEELRKQSEKNEALLDKKDFFNDSGNEDDTEFNNNKDDDDGDDRDNKDKGKFAYDGKKKEPLANSSINLERAVLRHKPESRTSNAINNNLASRISIFSSETRPSPSSTHHETKSRLAVKEKLCTGSYGRALDKFSSKSGTADGIKPLQLPKSRRTTVKS